MRWKFEFPWPIEKKQRGGQKSKVSLIVRTLMEHAIEMKYMQLNLMGMSLVHRARLVLDG
jgi:hypothetical protein